MIVTHADAQDLAVSRDRAAQAVERFSHKVPPAFRLQKPVEHNRALPAL
jgi:hypothetical protein